MKPDKGTANGASVRTEFHSRVAHERRRVLEWGGGRLGVSLCAPRSHGFWARVNLQRGHGIALGAEKETRR